MLLDDVCLAYHVCGERSGFSRHAFGAALDVYVARHRLLAAGRIAKYSALKRSLDEALLVQQEEREMRDLNALFSPGRIGSLELRNRIVMAALSTYSANYDGTISERVVAFYEERARGGVGLIVPTALFVTPDCAAPHCLSIHDDRFIPPLSALCEAIHRHGAAVAAQLAHPGIGLLRLWQGYEAPSGLEPVGPSIFPCIPWRTTPREIRKDEIETIVEAYGAAALRAREAGVDAIEVHAAHGYMIGSFMSPLKNRRTDEYGGSIENRARFAVQCIESVRKAVGPSLPILVRFNVVDGLEGGVTLEDSLAMAPLFVGAGVDALDVTAGAREAPWWDDAIYLRPDALLAPLCAELRKVVEVPVIACGKMRLPEVANAVIERGSADFVAMARPLLADPALPNKARNGRLEDIRYCIACNNCRLDLFDRERLKRRGATLGCTVNPAAMREAEFASMKPAGEPRRVLVAGGGLAGLEVGRIAAERGHAVSLFEKSDRLGGQWNIAASQPMKEHYATVLAWRVRAAESAGVRIELNQSVTKELVARELPDVVVVATGARNMRLSVPGIDKSHVVQATDVFLGKAGVGQRVAVIGGRLRGMEAADMLADQGKKVAVITKAPLGVDGPPLERNTFFELFSRLIDKGVTVYELAPVVEILDRGVYIDYRDELFFVPADTVVLGVGAEPENSLVRELEGLPVEVLAIGDCVKSGYARDAIEMAANVGLQI